MIVCKLTVWLIETDVAVVGAFEQGSHTSLKVLKVLKFFPSIFKALKVLENGVGA